MGSPFLQVLEARKVQQLNRGAPPYELEVYCGTLESCTGWVFLNSSQQQVRFWATRTDEIDQLDRSTGCFLRVDNLTPALIVYMYVCIYIYIYVCCRVKNWSNFALFVLNPTFCLGESRSLSAERREKQEQQNTTSCVKNWSNFVAQCTWTSF